MLRVRISRHENVDVPLNRLDVVAENTQIPFVGNPDFVRFLYHVAVRVRFHRIATPTKRVFVRDPIFSCRVARATELIHNLCIEVYFILLTKPYIKNKHEVHHVSHRPS